MIEIQPIIDNVLPMYNNIYFLHFLLKLIIIYYEEVSTELAQAIVNITVCFECYWFAQISISVNNNNSTLKNWKFGHQLVSF